MAEAVAIRGDRIMAVGSNEDIRQLIADWTEVVDAKGYSVIPGMIDSHNHLYEHTLDFPWSLKQIPEMLEVRIGAKGEGEGMTVEEFTNIVLGAIKARAAQLTRWALDTGKCSSSRCCREGLWYHHHQRYPG